MSVWLFHWQVPFLNGLNFFYFLFILLFSVTSSEKVDKAQRYADFTLLSVPYPGTFSVSTWHSDTVFRNHFISDLEIRSLAVIVKLYSHDFQFSVKSTYSELVSGCEFFKDYKDRDYTAEGLVFNWNQVEYVL